MTFSEEIGLTGLAAIGTIGSVCAVLLRSTHQNLKTLDTMRRDATAAAEKLRRELRDHDDTIFKLQELCADYRFALAKLEGERDLLLRCLAELEFESNERFSQPDRPEHWQAPPDTAAFNINHQLDSDGGVDCHLRSDEPSTGP